MKKFILSLLIGSALLSCEKSTFQQTSDQIKKADSLFTQANNGLKTIDSISKTINGKDGIANKVIIPEIEKQKKAIDSTLKSGNWKIDSINKQINEITKNVKTGTDVLKTLDSASSSLKKGDHPLDVLSKTADKILKSTKTETQNSPAKPQTETQNSPQNSAPIVISNPLKKTGSLEIQVENLSDAKALLKQKIRESNADLLAENFSQTEGISKETFSIKVPLSTFESLVNSTTNLGEIRMKSIVSDGIDYHANQKCDLEISLLQNENLATNPINKNENDTVKTDTFSDKSSNAFMQGFKVLGDAMLFLLPFWPIFLIAFLIWYFVRRNNKKKTKEALEKQQILHQNSLKNASKKEENLIVEEETKSDENDKNDETDYSKYMPK